MIITGALFAEKIEVVDGKVNITGGNPSTYTVTSNTVQTVVPVLLFVTPTDGDVGDRKDLQVTIVDTEGAVVGKGPGIAWPDAHTGGTIAVAEVHTEFEKPWHYFLYVGEYRVTGFDVYFANDETAE
jgi:hypothetical protein